MKKWRVWVAILAVLAILSGLMMSSTYQNNASAGQDSMFVVLEGGGSWDAWVIVYHKETRVMYAVSLGSYNRGTFTLLVDIDGKPMLYQE